MTSSPTKRAAAAALPWLAPPLLLVLAAVGAGGTGSEPGAPAFWRSAGVAGLALGVALLLGLGLALLTSAVRLPLRRTLLVLCLLPLVVPRYLAASSWIDLLGPAGRLTRLWSPAPGAPSMVAEHWIYTWESCGFLLGCCLFPLPLLAARAALLRAQPSALEAARLARGRVGELRLLLATATPAALAGALLAGTLAGLEFAVPQILRVTVQSEEVYTLMSERESARALTTGLPLAALALAATLLAFLVWRRRPPASGPGVEPRRAGPLASVGLLGAALLALTPGLWFPLASLALRLAEVVRLAPPDDPHPAWRAIHEAAVVGGADAWRSTQVGLVTACVGLALSLAIGWPLRRRRGAVAAVALVVLAALLTVPPPLIGTALLLTLNRPGLAWTLDRLHVVSLACLLRFLPAAVLLAWTALARVPPEQEDAARLAGRGRWARLAWVGLPPALPALGAAWLLLYVLAATEFGASVLVVPPGASVLAVFVVNEAHYGQGDYLAGLFVLLLIVVLAPLVVAGALGGAWRLLRREAA